MNEAGCAAPAGDIPAGFERLAMGGPFIATNGPFYVSKAGARVRLGMRIEPRHGNAGGICHGGMIATFADMLLPATVRHSTETAAAVAGRFLPTVSLQMDYMAPLAVGDWLEGEAEVLKMTRSLMFVQGIGRVGSRVAFRCSGVLAFGPKYGDDEPGSAAPPPAPSRPA